MIGRAAEHGSTTAEKEDEMKGRKIGLVGLAIVVALGVWGGSASAESRREHFNSCGDGSDYYTEQQCCEESGGVYESKFQGVDEAGDPMFVDYCNLDGKDDEEWTAEVTGGEPSWQTNNTVDTSTSTAEQPEQQTWTDDNTATTSGTAEQYDEGSSTTSGSTSETASSDSGASEPTYDGSHYDEGTSSYDDSGYEEEPAPRNIRETWYD
jgi:hypothetical protein